MIEEEIRSKKELEDRQKAEKEEADRLAQASIPI